MPSENIFRKSEIAFLRELKRQRVRFLVVGLSAANLQGATVVTGDIDLWFERLDHPGIWRAVKKVKGCYIPATRYTPPRLGGDSLALFDLVFYMHGLESFAKEYARAHQVRLFDLTLKVLPLDRIIASKRAANREKDKLVLHVLADTAATLRARQAKRKPRVPSRK